MDGKNLFSPVELRVYDSQGRVTGVVDGEEKNEIPYSSYYENTVTIFFPSGSYSYEVAGIGEGLYDLTVTQVGEQTSSFTLTNVPTSTSAVHEYTIDWDTLSQGGKGVTMKIDSDGDGTFKQAIHLSGIEEGKEGLPIWVWFTVVGVAAAFIASFVVWRRMARKQETKA